jgi:hypothetical protein
MAGLMVYLIEIGYLHEVAARLRAIINHVLLHRYQFNAINNDPSLCASSIAAILENETPRCLLPCIHQRMNKKGNNRKERFIFDLSKMLLTLQNFWAGCFDVTKNSAPSRNYGNQGA